MTAGEEPLASWVRDFALLGGGTGFFAPSILGLVIWMTDGTFQAVEVLVPVGAVCGVIGVLAGVIVGTAFRAVTRWLREWPLVLFPIGFPVGGISGAVPGWIIARVIEPYSMQTAIAGASISGIAGGLVLGLVWVPYLAMRLRGRPGWPVILGMTLFAPVIGMLAVIGFGVMWEALH
ncbi:MAG: hypothetical protein H6737_25405 [Alphaproteobacteria bacterium]|nr:hypothetical protein [Alphaproteobacteria bacterium]